MQAWARAGRAGTGALALGLLALSGCGSMRDTPEQEITIRCTPGGALVTIDGREYGRTPNDANQPLRVALSRDRDHEVVLEKESFLPRSASIRRRPLGATTADTSPDSWIGNTISSPFLAKYRLEPERLFIQLIRDPDGRSRAGSVQPDRAEAKRLLTEQYKRGEIDSATFESEMLKLYPAGGQ